MNHTKQCMVFAHRGANREAAENTRAAFDKALEYAVDGIETDVQLSRDEVAVLWHDRLLGKIGHPDKHIDDFDYSQLQAMNFAGHFAPTSKVEGIISLQQFLDAYRKRCRLLIEIKNREWEPSSRHEIKVRQTLDLIGTVHDDAIILNSAVGSRTSCPHAGGTPALPEIMASSFNLASLIYAHQYRPGFPLLYNFENDQTLAYAKRVLAEHSFLHGLCLPIATLDDAMTKLLRDHSKCIAVYTCNSDEEINKALKLDVDILISDVPQKSLMMRKAFS